jgi:16S rRNA (cytosine967-C5)-methyltransferase
LNVAAGTPARTAALEVLRRVRSGRRFEEALTEAAASLDQRDRRLTYEIAAGVLRHRTRLDLRVDPLLTQRYQPLDPDLRDLLRIGAYQLLFLERIPRYAALSTTVEIAKQQLNPGAARLVNAVLRRLTRDPGSSDGPFLDLADEHSHPRWLVERWTARFGHERTEALLRHNNQQPSLVLQPLDGSTPALEAMLSDAGIASTPAPLGVGVVVQTGSIRTLPGYECGAFVVQDAAQAHLLDSLSLPLGATVWDACASPGGKTAVLSRRARHVLASDLRRDRIQMLRDTVTRTAPGVSLVVADARRPPLKYGARDVVLVDAPCSATGTMARHPDARWRLSADRLRHLVERQRAILDGVASILDVGGRLVYLTCSLEPEENELQIEDFLERHPSFDRACDDSFVFPADAGTDGGYAAQLSRRA